MQKDAIVELLHFMLSEPIEYQELEGMLIK